jgi:hypothetical protein
MLSDERSEESKRLPRAKPRGPLSRVKTCAVPTGLGLLSCILLASNDSFSHTHSDAKRFWYKEKSQ